MNILTIDNITKAYGERKLFADASFYLAEGEKAGIIGSNGCGKSTLMKIIAGMILPDSGQVIIVQTVKMGYYAQENASEKNCDEIDLSYMDPKQRVIDYVKDTAEYIQITEGSISASAMLEDYPDCYEGIVVTVFHDRYFLDRTMKRIFAFEEGEKLKQYTDYSLKKLAEKEDAKQAMH